MGSYRLGIVGEANYQAAIAGVRAGQAVQIEHEPDNPFDPRAVRVSAGGKTIGYAPRDGWITRALLDEGREIGATIEQVTGGTAGAPAKGIVLTIVLDGEAAPLRQDSAARRPAAMPPPRPSDADRFMAGYSQGLSAGRPKPVAAHPPTVIYILLVIICVAGLATCVGTPGDPAKDKAEASAAATEAALSPEAVAKCRAVNAKAVEVGLIRKRPAPNRINVDERLWAELDAETKDRALQAVACEVWQRNMPPKGEHVVAYGWRSGKRIQMLTEVGMLRE